MQVNNSDLTEVTFDTVNKLAVRYVRNYLKGNDSKGKYLFIKDRCKSVNQDVILQIPTNELPGVRKETLIMVVNGFLPSLPTHWWKAKASAHYSSMPRQRYAALAETAHGTPTRTRSRYRFAKISAFAR